LEFVRRSDAALRGFLQKITARVLFFCTVSSAKKSGDGASWSAALQAAQKKGTCKQVPQSALPKIESWVSQFQEHQNDLAEMLYYHI